MIDKQHTLYEYEIEHNSKKPIINLNKEIAARGIISDIIKDNDMFFIAFKTNGVLRLIPQKRSTRQRTSESNPAYSDC